MLRVCLPPPTLLQPPPPILAKSDQVFGNFKFRIVNLGPCPAFRNPMEGLVGSRDLCS